MPYHVGLKKETWKWYYCDSIQGEENSYELAVQALERHLPFRICDAWEDYSSDFFTIYFYSTETDAEQDRDGAYTPSVTFVVQNGV